MQKNTRLYDAVYANKAAVTTVATRFEVNKRVAVIVVDFLPIYYFEQLLTSDVWASSFAAT